MTILFTGRVEFGPEVSKSSEKAVKHPVHSSDPIYLDIRDSHFSSVFALLKKKGQELKAEHERRQKMNITAMKDFIAKELKLVQSQHKSLSLRKFVLELKKIVPVLTL